MKNIIFICFLIILLILFLINKNKIFENFRILNLNSGNNEKLLLNYSSLPKYDFRVVLSITISKNDLDSIYPTLLSLLDQTHRTDMIYLNYIGDIHEIPENCKQISLCYQSKKYNNLFIPTLLREEDANTIIIQINNLQIFPKNTIKNLIEKSLSLPDHIIKDSYDNELLKPKFFSYEDLYENINSENILKNKKIYNLKK